MLRLQAHSGQRALLERYQILPLYLNERMSEWVVRCVLQRPLSRWAIGSTHIAGGKEPSVCPQPNELQPLADVLLRPRLHACGCR